MHIAYCSDTQAFNADRLRDKQWSYRFPGSGWITCLYRVAAESGINMASGDIAIANVVSGKWNAADVFVIQDMQSTDASKLLDLGAIPFLITCFEAPLYAPFFYDNIRQIARNFNFSLGFGFSDIQDACVITRKNPHFRFPSYYLEDLREAQPWGIKKKLVIIAANKYKTKKIFFHKRISLINFLRQLKSASSQLTSPSYRKSLAASLHDRRLNTIEYFAQKKELDLYGGGWGNLNELPFNWINRLKYIIGSQYIGICDNKLETLSAYRFSVCFENMVCTGYITEKIIDCFVAGVIPLYLGAPDIEKNIPSDSFIDMRNFNCLDQVKAYIDSIKKDDADRMIKAGRDYLQSEMGILHSYEGFARNIINLILTC